MLRNVHRSIECRMPLCNNLKTLYHGGKRTDRTGTSAIEIGRGLADDFPKGELMLIRGNQNSVYRRIPDPPARVVDHPFDCLLIIGVECQPEIRYQIFDFFALVKRSSSVNLVGDV